MEPLENIINLSFGKGIYIENLKISKTIPVFKGKGSPLDYNNYRPISLLSNVNKLFDTVDHNIFLIKLDYYGIRGIAINWFRSYLTNRKQYVTIAGGNSELKIMKFGVPQGSLLGSLLFLLYINDLNKAINYCVTRHFADDTNLLIKNKSLKQLKNIQILIYVNL